MGARDHGAGSAIAKIRGERDVGVLVGGTIPDSDPKGGVSGHNVKSSSGRMLSVGHEKGDGLSASRAA